jgi:outer membrane receptor protein involved in Fe transport
MKNLFFSVLFTLITSIVFSQITVKGTVKDIHNNPIDEVQVLVNNSRKGTVTNKKGEFTLLNITNGADLTIRFLGYTTQIVAAKENLSITLLEDSSELDLVVVSASRTVQKREELPVAISSISAATIEELQPTSVDQVLNQTSGVNMVDLGNEQHMMAIRQPISTKSLFLYLEDGIPIRPTGVFNHNALLEMNMGASKNIEIIRGPYSSLYGSEAIGGAINFITEDPSKEALFEFGIAASDIGYLKAETKYSQTFNKTGVYISATQAAINNGIRDYGDYSKSAITAKVTHNFSDTFSWNNTLTYIDYFSEMSGNMDDVKFENEDYSSYHTFTFRDDKALRFNSNLNKIWNDKNNTSLSLVYRDNSMGQNPSYRIADDTAFGDHTSGELNENSFQSFVAYLQHNINFDKYNSKVSFGGNIDYSPKSYYAKILDVARNLDGMFSSYTETGNYNSDYDATIVNTGLFITGEMEFIKNLKLNAGFRYDSFSYDFDNKLESAGDYKAEDTKETYNSFAPRLGMVYNFNKNVGTYANYSVGYIPPSISDLFRKTDVPLLDPTTFNNYEIGGWVSALDNKLYFDYAAYYLQGKDEVVSVTTKIDGVTVRENQNVGETSHKGVEFGVKYKFNKVLKFHYSAAYSIHTYEKFITKIVDGEATQDFSNNEMPGAPNYISNSGITYKPKFAKGFRIGIEWQHVGEYFTDDKNEMTYDGYDIFNARLGYDMKHLSFYINAMNFTDELYSTRTSYSWGKTTYRPGNPMNLLFGVKYKM